MDDKAIKALVASSQLAVSVKDYGAKGDGITDDTLAFNNALSAVSRGGKLIIPSGTYKINGPVSAVCTGDVEIEGQYGVTLDCTSSKAADGSSIIQIGGGVATSYNLTGNVTKYGNLIPCAQAFNQGDIVQLISTDLWNPQRANYVKGEFCEVESTNAGMITTKGSIYDNYSAAATKARKLIMPRVKMSNIVIKCNSFTIGLMLTTIKELHLEDVLVTGAKYSGISVTNIYGGLVENCEATDCYSPANPTAASYGLVISSCQGLTVLGGHYLGGRHGISHGGTTPVRDIVIQGATVGNNSTTAETSLDAHGNTENIIVRDCRINNGMTLLALNVIVENNHIQVMAFTTGIQIVPEINAGIILVQNNTVINPNPNGSGIIIAVASSGIASLLIDKVTIKNNYIRCLNRASRGIIISPSGKKLTITNVTIENNDVQSAADGVLFIANSDSVIIQNNYFNTTETQAGISITTDSLANPFLITKLIIKGNYIESAARGIQLGSASSSTAFTINRITIEDNDVQSMIQSFMIYIQRTNAVVCKEFRMLGGSYSSVNNSPATLQFSIASANAPMVRVSECSFTVAAAAGGYGFILCGGGNAKIEKCAFAGSPGLSYINVFQALGELYLTKNIFTNFSTGQGITFSGAEFTAWDKPTLSLLEGNVFKNCSGAVTSGMVRTGTSLTQSGNLMAYLPAVPTSGSWLRGDVVLNTLPASQGFIGWVCTNAGTPGTWKSYGVLS